MVKGLFLLCWLVSAVCTAQEGLINGRVVDKREFPELIRIKQCRADGSCATCSATVVGPRVILTAAHCSSSNGEVVDVSETDDYTFETAAGRYRARCTLSPHYRTGDHDMALCLSSAALPPPFASVSKAVPRVGEIITLSGYGCTRSDGTGGNNGTLRVGESKVSSLPSGQPHGYWFETLAGSALCFGDSGGPAYRQIQPGRPHEIYGVNSRGNIADLSLLTALGLWISKEFMQDFERKNSVRICGLSENCNGKA